MLYSYWRIGPEGLRSPRRPNAYATRDEAVLALGPRHRMRRDFRRVALLVRQEGGVVVPELGLQADRDWSLKCLKAGSRITIYGEIPEALWYEDR